ncbi:hypothetical protein AMS68_004213 [Peltaster fructicola]|uniref:Glycosyl transferase CAP10 domain-containing protein n=1 Tax=Peltaster fructicola TaxID=286661 RepID=A0A6H0XVI1_9PEZI|nr:hypothetical protein AMS68_004213 [Peltaster fructicola]
MRAVKRLVFATCLVVVSTILYIRRSGQPGPKLGAYAPACHAGPHPIDGVITRAGKRWDALRLEETISIDDAAAAYRKRRERHPPPGFGAWYRHAKASGAVIVEDFFDQIYNDLEPFWGLDVNTLLARVAVFPDVLTVRNGSVQDVPNEFFRTKIWVEMMSKIPDLPDMDIALNRLDEARVIAPASEIDATLMAASKRRKETMKRPNNSFHETMQQGSSTSSSHVIWNTGMYELRSAIRASCPTPYFVSLPSHAIGSDTTIYLENTIAAKDICHNLELFDQHGALIEPATVDFTTTLFPIFTGSKLPAYNDIVIPEPSYYSDDPSFTGKSFGIDWSTYYPWKTKINGLVWRGGSTGGAAHDNNWKQFHRQRLISRLNASEYDESVYPARPKDERFADWLASVTNVAFTRLFCGDQKTAEDCPSMASRFTIAKPIKMASQYRWKYLPDTDGNSISERFRAFLLSNSAPIKASIFDDWQDHRLIAWKHYIPMRITYNELHDLMAYFLGYDKTCPHDAEGEKIAHEGREWAEKVLRKEDMVIYLHRVLLEYARVMNPERDRLGFVSDLS